METIIISNETFWNDLKNAYNTDLSNWADYMMLKQKMSEEAVKIIGEQWNVNLQATINELDNRLSQVPSLMMETPAVKQIIAVREFVSGEQKLRNKIEGLLTKVDFDKVGT